MPRKVHVVTTSGFDYESSIADNRERAFSFVASAGRRGADLVCLPETFLGRENEGAIETLAGGTFEKLFQLAREYQLWVVAGSLLFDHKSGCKYNEAIVIDRSGTVAGLYAKVHPTIGECEDRRRITPGGEAVVVETDFGRLGLAICYDIGWPSHWADLARQGAEVVVWPSAYDGGFPLQSYAWTHGYYIISAVLSSRAKVVDVTGSVLASTGSWSPIAEFTVDLEKELFHSDNHEEKLLQVRDELGALVAITAFEEENYFSLESNDPEWPVSRIKSHYGLENFSDYHARAERVQDGHRRDTANPVVPRPRVGVSEQRGKN
jgi:predicted amidohydrolase